MEHLTYEKWLEDRRATEKEQRQNARASLIRWGLWWWVGAPALAVPTIVLANVVPWLGLPILVVVLLAFSILWDGRPHHD